LILNRMTLAIGAILALACCNAGDPVASVPAACQAPSGVKVALAYPAPGSSPPGAAPDNFPAVILASSSQLPSSYSAYVVATAPTPSNSSNYGTVQAAPSPLPSPLTLPSFPNPVFQASDNPGVTWPAGSMVSVYLNESNASCVATSFLGSFKLQ
jgi:hypothetical protein